MKIREIKLNVLQWKGAEASLSVDANMIAKGQALHSITIRRDPKPLKLVHPRHFDFYDTLQSKLNWETKV